MSNLKKIRENLGMKPSECAEYLELNSVEELTKIENDKTSKSKFHEERLAKLDAIIENSVIMEVDLFSQLESREVILIRFLNDEEFALYEPDLFEDLRSSSIHGNFIARAKEAIERIGGDVSIAFMDSEFYEAWLGVNDFDDNKELRILWAHQQIKGSSH